MMCMMMKFCIGSGGQCDGIIIIVLLMLMGVLQVLLVQGLGMVLLVGFDVVLVLILVVVEVVLLLFVVVMQQVLVLLVGVLVCCVLSLGVLWGLMVGVIILFLVNVLDEVWIEIVLGQFIVCVCLGEVEGCYVLCLKCVVDLCVVFLVFVVFEVVDFFMGDVYCFDVFCSDVQVLQLLYQNIV